MTKVQKTDNEKYKTEYTFEFFDEENSDDSKDCLNSSEE